MAKGSGVHGTRSCGRPSRPPVRRFKTGEPSIRTLQNCAETVVIGQFAATEAVRFRGGESSSVALLGPRLNEPQAFCFCSIRIAGLSIDSPMKRRYSTSYRVSWMSRRSERMLNKICSSLAPRTRVAPTMLRRPRSAQQTREQTKPVRPAAPRQSGHARRGCRNNDGRPNR